jgi:hypothetical protein
MVKKHESTVTELSKPYEQNVIGFGGIIKFAIGLFLLIVVTFALMLLLHRVLEDNKAEEFRQQQNPMAMTDREQLPPEPRLQVAPGSGVDSADGRVNLELNAPQSEYRELKREWDAMREHGTKDKTTGAIVSMPIEEAKEKVLEENLKAKSGTEAEQFFKQSQHYISDSSSGRKATVTRR